MYWEKQRSKSKAALQAAAEINWSRWSKKGLILVLQTFLSFIHFTSSPSSMPTDFFHCKDHTSITALSLRHVYYLYLLHILKAHFFKITVLKVHSSFKTT